jgi:hypothetical protein
MVMPKRDISSVNDDAETIDLREMTNRDSLIAGMVSEKMEIHL